MALAKLAARAAARDGRRALLGAARTGRAMNQDTPLDLLLDLKHDLGKYLLLPFSLLPRDADQVALRAALRQALCATRVAGGAAQSAREIWQRFAAELDAALAPGSGLDALRAAVERALCWERALGERGALDRAAIERDFAAVQAAIAALIDEVRNG